MQVELSLVTSQDCKKVYRWRTDPEIMSYGFSDAISWDDHKAWFYYLLTNNDRLGFVVLADDVPTGFINFSRADWGADLSIYIMGKRRHGIGKQALELALTEVRKRWGALNIYALVKDSNERAQKFFEACGFREIRKAEGCIVYESKH